MAAADINSSGLEIPGAAVGEVESETGLPDNQEAGQPGVEPQSAADATGESDAAATQATQDACRIPVRMVGIIQTRHSKVVSVACTTRRVHTRARMAPCRRGRGVAS